jgi:hypothetical protein
MNRNAHFRKSLFVAAALLGAAALALRTAPAADVSTLVEQLGVGDVKSQEAAAKSLAAAARTADLAALKRAVPAMLTNLKEGPPMVRKSLCTTLTRLALRIKDQTLLQSMLEPLKGTKKDAKTCVRCHGAAALGAVATGLTKEDEESARYALRTLALGMKGKGGHSVIGSAKVFGRIAPRVRDAKLRKDALDFLRQATQFPNKGVAQEATKTLKAMETPPKPTTNAAGNQEQG